MARSGREKVIAPEKEGWQKEITRSEAELFCKIFDAKEARCRDMGGVKETGEIAIRGRQVLFALACKIIVDIGEVLGIAWEEKKVSVAIENEFNIMGALLSKYTQEHGDIMDKTITDLDKTISCLEKGTYRECGWNNSNK